MLLKLIGLALINIVTYPLVVLITGGFFLLGRISFLDFLSKCGYVPLNNKEGKEFIWLHMSSAGEWNTGKIFAKHLQKKSGMPLLITYFNGDFIHLFNKEREFSNPKCATLFLPVENCLSLGLIHHHYRIRALVIVETEFWPSLILMTNWLKKPLFLVNATLFDKETRHLLFFRPVFSRILRCFHHIFCVSLKVRKNFLKLGVKDSQLSTWSNFKYDLFERVKNLDGTLKKTGKNQKTPMSLEEKSRKELQDFFTLKKNTEKNTMVFASFHSGEFTGVIPRVEDFFRDEGFVNILAPREIGPQFIDSLERFLKKRGLPYLKRSELSQWLNLKDKKKVPSTLILDSLGELSSIYSLVDLVIMGGTFIPVGGHNFLEAVFFDKKVFMGKFFIHYEDFVDNFKEHLQFTDNGRIKRDINDFFSFKRKQLHGGFKKIQGLSGSSMKVAGIVNEKINSNF